MKHLVFILILILLPLSCFSQKEVIYDGRPVSMGYCSSTGSICTGDVTSITSEDVSGFLLRISFVEDLILKVKLYRNGELVEEIFSDGFKSVRITKTSFRASCNYFEWSKMFHNPTPSEANHQFFIDISSKKKKGTISFLYPEESRIYIYNFDLL